MTAPCYPRQRHPGSAAARDQATMERTRGIAMGPALLHLEGA